MGAGLASSSFHVLSGKPSHLSLPLVEGVVTAGFPSPAENYINAGIDLNEYLIQNPSSTFLLRVSGDSMNGAGIYNGDLLIVDRSLEIRPGRIVIAILDGNFILKRLVRRNENLFLEATNSNYPNIDIYKYGDIQIWGVAIYSIHNLKNSEK